MSDNFEFTLHSTLTKEDWNKLSDAEFENTMSVTFQTPQGRQVKYIKCEVLDKIRAEIEQAADKQFQIAMGVADLNERYTHIQMENAYRYSLNIIDKYKAESEKE